MRCVYRPSSSYLYCPFFIFSSFLFTFVSCFVYFIFFFFFLMIRRPPRSTLFPYTTLFRSQRCFSFNRGRGAEIVRQLGRAVDFALDVLGADGRDLSFFHHRRGDRRAGGADPDLTDSGRRALFHDSGDGIELCANRRRRGVFVQTLFGRLLAHYARQPAADSDRLVDRLSLRQSRSGVLHPVWRRRIEGDEVGGGRRPCRTNLSALRPSSSDRDPSVRSE